MTDSCARYDACRYDPACSLYGGCVRYPDEAEDPVEPDLPTFQLDTAFYSGWVQPCWPCQRGEIHTHLILHSTSRSLIDVELPPHDVPR